MSAENQNQEAAIDPQVEAPGEEPVNGDLMGRLLHQELHDGEVFNENYQIMLYRLMSAMSAASTKTVVESLDTRRANKVKELVNIFNNLMITETETQRVHCQMADRRVHARYRCSMRCRPALDIQQFDCRCAVTAQQCICWTRGVKDYML